MLAFVLAVSMFPQISIVSPLYLLLRELRLINTYPGLVLPYLTFAMPLTIWLLVGFFRQLPPELEEAALMDGAGRLRTLWEIVLPLAVAGAGDDRDPDVSLLLERVPVRAVVHAGARAHTVPVAITLFRGQYQVPWGQILAAAVVATVPVAAIVLVAQRRIVAGLTVRRGEGLTHGVDHA